MKIGAEWWRADPPRRRCREGSFVAGVLVRYRQAKPSAQSDLASHRRRDRQPKPAAQSDLAGGRQTEPAAQTDGTAVSGRAAHGQLQSRPNVEDYLITGRMTP